MGYIRVCDLCGKPLHETGTELKYRVKRRWYSFWESGWVTIECHDACVEKLFKTAKMEENRRLWNDIRPDGEG